MRNNKLPYSSKINTELLKDLNSKGYIQINTSDFTKIYYELLSLSEKGVETVRKAEERLACEAKSSQDGESSESSQPLVGLNTESNFESFRKFYPNRVLQGPGYRNLHSDLKRCKKLYDKLCMETSHDILCKCAELYIEDCRKSNTYIQNLATWLHQENYKNYLNDALETTNNQTNNFTNLEAI